jgi:hypothetical protein
MSTPHPDGGKSGDRAGRRPAHAHPSLDPAWAPEDAQVLANEAGLEALGDRHWKVLTTCREEAARTGHRPTLQQIETLTGFDAGELHALFPGDFDALVTRIAGLARRSHASRGRSGRGSKED